MNKTQQRENSLAAKRKVRIAHFIETDIPGGAEQVLLDLCEYINTQPNELECVLITFNHPWFKAQCKQRNIEYIEAPFRSLFKRTATLPLFAWKFGRWLKKQDIKLLHSHLFGPITAGAMAAFVARIPHIGTLHDVHMISEKPSRIRLIQLAALLNSKLVTVSNNMEMFYKESGYFPKSTFVTIYNGVKVAPNENTLKEGLALESRPTLVCVGRLVPLKQVTKVAEVVLELLRQYDFNFLIIGDGPEKLALDTLSGINNPKIQRLGERNDIDNLLSISDIFIQYSTTEGLSRSIIEAVSSGLPCVVSDVGGNVEIVKHGYNGMLVNPKDTKTLHNALEKLLCDASLRKTFSDNSLQYSKENFNFESNNGKYLDLYLPRV